MSNKPLHLGRLVDAQLAAVDAQARHLAEARALLLTVKSRIEPPRFRLAPEPHPRLAPIGRP